MHNKYHSRKPIKITEHAKQRLEERVGSHKGYKDWQHLVKTARYSGINETYMTDEERNWCKKHIHNCPTRSQIRILNGFAFIFMGNKGHARTLVTVISMA